MRVEEIEAYVPMETPIALVGSPSSEYFFRIQQRISLTGVHVVTGIDFSSLLRVYWPRLLCGHYAGFAIPGAKGRYPRIWRIGGNALLSDEGLGSAHGWCNHCQARGKQRYSIKPLSIGLLHSRVSRGCKKGQEIYIKTT